MTIRLSARAVLVCITATLTLASAGGRPAKADGIITADPSLPPHAAIGGQAAYLTPADVHAMYSGAGLLAVLSKVQHGGFTDIHVMTQGPNELENFQSQVTGLASVNGSPNTPFTLNGPVSVEAFGKAGMVSGTFDTQMLSLALTGTIMGIPVEIRVDPTNASTGSTTITDIGGGLFHITSFFDVFTDLSIDGGVTFIPSTGPAPVFLQTVPEPAAWIMFLTAGLVVPVWARSARRRK
jgi:hypothetical protein